MDYTTPPPMSASTLLGATQLNIVADDIIDIEGRCKAPNVPFERVSINDHGTPSQVREGQYDMIHKYITSASEHLGLEYHIVVTGGTGSGNSATSTCMLIDGTSVCKFTDSTGSTVYRGVKDLSTLDDEDDKHHDIAFKVHDSVSGNGNTTYINYLGQLKASDTNYSSFSASRFRDGRTTSACGDLHTLRSNIIALNSLAKRGAAGFRARETPAMINTSGNKQLFDGYLKSTRGGRLYVVVGYTRDGNAQSTVHFKTTFNGSALTTISMSGSEHKYPMSSMVTTACALPTTGISHDVNDEVRVIMSACTTAQEDRSVDRGYLLYMAEAPGGSISGWVTPATFTAGCYVLGNSACPSASNQWLSTAASDIEQLAGDTSRKGYGSTASSSGSYPVGNARAVYRFPVHRRGVQHGEGLVNITDSRQRIYAIHTGDTGYYRCNGKGVMNYPATTASPNTYDIESISSASEYDSINMTALPDLPLGMLYYTEVGVNLDEDNRNDFIEERYS